MSCASSIRITAAALALVLIGCAGGAASYPDELTLTDLRREMLRGCDDRVDTPCPYILLDARPWSDYSAARLDDMNGSDIDRIATTKGACLVEWRFGVTGYTQAIEIWTKGHDGPASEHAEMPIEDRMVCEFEVWERGQPEGYTVPDGVADELRDEFEVAGSDSRTLADGVVDAIRLCSRLGRGCPLILIDTRPSSDYGRRELDAISLAAVARIDTTRGECLGVWRFGERGRNGAIEIYTEGFEGESLRHEEMPVEERLRCEAEIAARSSR